MHKAKIGIVEDEMIIALGISNTLQELGYDVTEPATSYTEALDMIATEKPDLLLVDIQLSGYKDGIDLAAKIRLDPGIPFMFLTANADPVTVKRAKEVHPHAYLVKPFRKDDIYTAIELCLHNYGASKQRKQVEGNYIVNNAIFIKQGSLFHKVKIEDILYLESDNVYVNVYTASGKLLVRNTLQDYIELIGSPLFVRVHRSYAVNINHIEAINTEYLVINKIEIPVSKAFRDSLFRHLKLG
ncbi:LytTR family DNA-binding domain-containing protein [Chitinophaga sp. CF418]|uniref:LytR/AlgR family response regulator transcription factor n=1 Tax=Chitinophaga sp. CF418 TaxID=1855287 RepID=UPI00091F76A8|nr:response regulator [Chitinophaga sp. CF418]SHL96942.1 two component transcriptional regulator, LytTR family [Chitinophaga sp. CF418]